ncbi:transglutaminase family protein [Pseudoruegeria sp. HB172150]|uniref:transglutaminase family protein n=1 Tax=Pseudoruegeria sp. HB172150 TaxID=2721164 RepID=UPI001556EF2C|nr:transglutaminase family protein [Pseudoruegeria sp. HB172150]
MLYDVSLTITYEYDTAADAGRHVLRIVPADLPGEQRVIASSLSIKPEPTERITRRDFFDNACVEIAYDAPLTETEFRVTARVERFEPVPVFDVSPSLEGLYQELANLGAIDNTAPHHFRFSSERVGHHPEIVAWARETTAGARTAYAAAQAICDAVHRDLTFDPEATMVDTAVDEAWKLKRGVCQDFTHISIAALRGLGIPAGYVSGYLRTIPPEGEPKLEGADAMHAWVRAWCGSDMGWMEFDPTNAMPAGLDHIVVARGRDYFDLAPVKGAMRTAGSQKTKQAVDVEEVG